MGIKDLFKSPSKRRAEKKQREQKAHQEQLDAINSLRPFLGEPDNYVDGEPAWLGSTWKKAAHLQMRFERYGPFMLDPDCEKK
jgi:hypothetical protein